MNALQIAIHNRDLALDVYNAALMAHAERQWDKKLKAVIVLAGKIYQERDEAVRNAPGYLEQFSK